MAIYGPREAARKAGIPEGSVLRISSQRKWKKAVGFRPSEVVPADAPDVGDVIAKAMAQSKEQSALHLAQYTQKASKKAAEHKDPLEVARKVRDVAGVYQVLFPPEEETSLIEGSILVGEALVTDNPQEILARAEVKDAHVREKLPG